MGPTSWELVDDDIVRFMDLHCQEMRRDLTSRRQLSFHYEEARQAALEQLYKMDLPPDEVTPNVFILYVGMLAYEEYYPGAPSPFLDRLDQEFQKARSTLHAKDPTHQIAAEYAVFYKQRLKEAQRHTHEARMGHLQHSRAIDLARLPDVDAASVGSSRQSEDLAKQMVQFAASDHPPSLFGTPSTSSASRPGAEYFHAKESLSVAPAVTQTTKAPNRVAMPSIAAQKQQTQGNKSSTPPPRPQAVASPSATRPGPKQPSVAPSSPPAPIQEPSLFSSQQGPDMFRPPSNPKVVAPSSSIKPGVKQPPVAPSNPPAPVKEPSLFSSQQGPDMFRPPSKPKVVAPSSSIKPGVKQPSVAPSSPPAPIKEPSLFSSQQGPDMFRPPSKPKAVASLSSVEPGVKQPPGPPSKPKAIPKAVSSVDVDGAFQVVFPPRTTPTRWADEESDGADEAVPQQATEVHKGLSASRHAPPARKQQTKDTQAK
ncbi:uncharacterized protein B0T23DRAFT_425799 [Neurospora hispaniola]|uniref:Uncharacterized protein n=1 Tax=Neurospora hispaniola TaxID=588809 RepID=A0AAJ0MWJ6_9PEZI|nr:hypothetical protein B0T23DRAFT_425799 [Neurospora hispaniola]